MKQSSMIKLTENNDDRLLSSGLMVTHFIHCTAKLHCVSNSIDSSEIEHRIVQYSYRHTITPFRTASSNYLIFFTIFHINQPKHCEMTAYSRILSFVSVISEDEA